MFSDRSPSSLRRLEFDAWAPGRMLPCPPMHLFYDVTPPLASLFVLRLASRHAASDTSASTPIAS
jgi:hypothetical protein